MPANHPKHGCGIFIPIKHWSVCAKPRDLPKGTLLIASAAAFTMLAPSPCRMDALGDQISTLKWPPCRRVATLHCQTRHTKEVDHVRMTACYTLLPQFCKNSLTHIHLFLLTWHHHASLGMNTQAGATVLRPVRLKPVSLPQRGRTCLGATPRPP